MVVGLLVGPAAAGARADRVVTEDGRVYESYRPAATKEGQYFYYTCEFDAAWVVLKTFGYDVPFEEQLEIVGHDRTIEPYYEQTPDGFVIHGGDITSAFSGDYANNLLARTTGRAMMPLFEEFGLEVERVRNRAEVETALDRGALVWMKATVDFLPWEPSTWITPEGEEIETVLGNDHAVVVIGYNEDVAVIRDVLGPTNTNWSRAYEYEVPWDTFLEVWAAQDYDGLSVAPAADDADDGSDEEPAAPVIQPIDVSGSA